LEILKIYLSPIGVKGFKAIFTNFGETESSLPFFEGEKDWRTTILRCLEMSTFNPQYFLEEEQEWMVKSGILDKNRNNFDNDYLKNVGRKAYQSLFPADSKAKNALFRSLHSSEEKNTRLHIQLTFQADVIRNSRLADYPWELLHDGEKFLLHRNVTISRYIAYESVPPKLPATDKVNVLLVSSAAQDSELELKELSELEMQAIRKGLKNASNAGHINLVKLEYATRDGLRAYLTEHRGEDAPHVLHFDGHGLFGKRCSNPECRTMHKGNKPEKCRKCDRILPDPQGYLVFEDADYISAEEFGVLLRQSSLGDGSNKSGGIALVVLSACQSGMALDRDSVFNGTAQNLISHRIPSVVAMQYSVSVASATKFAEQFYRSLGQKNSLGIAIAQAREVMGIEGNQWYRPVLYLRWEDNEGGQLFRDFPTQSNNIPQNKLVSSVNDPKNQPLSNALDLNNKQQQKLQEALISAFPSEAKLTMMLEYQLEIRLNTIAGGSNYEEIMFNLVKWFENQGRLQDLIDAARRKNSGNPKLKEFAREIGLVDS
jgi:hypothetical protein